MKPEAQRIAIAEACGWTKRDVDYGPRTENLWISPEGLTNGQSDTAFWLPDYLNDLNAMHEAEVPLMTANIWPQYREHLSRCSPMFTHRATAAQRAEAFLKCLGLWKDDACPQSEISTTANP